MDTLLTHGYKEATTLFSAFVCVCVLFCFSLEKNHLVNMGESKATEYLFLNEM